MHDQRGGALLEYAAIIAARPERDGNALFISESASIRQGTA